MNYINLNRILTSGAAALLLALPMTACSKDDPQSAPDAQMTGTAASAQETDESADLTALTVEPEQNGSSFITSASASSSVSSAKDAAQTAETVRQETGSTKAEQNSRDSAAPVISGTGLTASAGEKRVAVPVTVRNNPGFAMIGISLHYDKTLTCLTTDSLLADYTLGEVAKGMTANCYVNKTDGTVGLGGISAGNLTADGEIFTCYFDIPEDAETGHTYQFSPSINYSSDVAGTPVAFETAVFTLTIQ